MNPDENATVSVVIPVHNGAKYLSEAIQSVRVQTVPATQIIVIDDGSTDDSAQVAQSIEGVEYAYQEQSGAATARNNGAERAQGEYLAFLDADDLWPPRKLEQQLAAFRSEPKYDMVFGQAEQFASPDLSDEERAKINVPAGTMPAIIASAMLMRRADFFRVGLLEAQWRTGEFIDWYLKAVEMKLQPHVLPETVLRRRIHATNGGIVNRDARSDYVHILKASLDRRRAHNADS